VLVGDEIEIDHKCTLRAAFLLVISFSISQLGRVQLFSRANRLRVTC
jgi:hypothetical protein